MHETRAAVSEYYECLCKKMNPKVFAALLGQIVTNTGSTPRSTPALIAPKMQDCSSPSGTTQLNLGTVVNKNKVTHAIQPQPQSEPELSKESVSMTIKVFNPSRKRECKTFVLSLKVNNMISVRALREEVLKQLGKQTISFDLNFDIGYISGSQKVSFSPSDNIRAELRRLNAKGKMLWCIGKRNDKCTEPGSTSVVCVDSESGDELEPPKKKQKQDLPKVSALVSKAQRIDSIANELSEIHGDACNKIQYKLWAEAIDVRKHDSKEIPPPGSIWNSASKVVKRSRSSDGHAIDEMASAFTTMANKVASALSPGPSSSSATTPTKRPEAGSVGISPGRRIDLQAKLFAQIDMIHGMFGRGAITSEQFERRRNALLTQLDELEL